MVADILEADRLKLTYLQGYNDLSGQTNSPLIIRKPLFDNFDIFNVPIKEMERQMICCLPEQYQHPFVGAYKAQSMNP